MATKSTVQKKVNNGLFNNAVSGTNSRANTTADPEIDLTKQWFSNSNYFTPAKNGNGGLFNNAVSGMSNGTDPEMGLTKNWFTNSKYFTPTNIATPTPTSVDTPTPATTITPTVTTPTPKANAFNYRDEFVNKGLGDGAQWDAMNGTEKAALIPFLNKSNESGFLSSVGGTQGLASILGGIGQIGSFWNGMEQNRRAEKEWDMRNAEVNRQKQRDVDFANAINKSGLGSYSAGIK